MNNQKNIYLIIMMFLGFLLYVQWQKDYPPVDKTAATESNQSTQQLADEQMPSTQTIEADAADIPKPTQPVNQSQTPVSQDLPGETTQVISTVETPLLTLQFSDQGGALVYAELKQYPLKKNEDKNVIYIRKLIS